MRFPNRPLLAAFSKRCGGAAKRSEHSVAADVVRHLSCAAG